MAPPVLVAAIVLALAPPAVVAPPAYEYPFQNPRLPLQARVDDLAGRLTLDEKISLLHQYQPAIPRLGIRLFKSGTEALHGLAWSNDYHDNGNVVTATATQFPQAVGLASSWDPGLVRRVGSAVGDEARQYHRQNPDVWGLNVWAPVVNLLRDPRWGRNEEGYSEDPLLTGELAVAYGTGLQGDDPRYLKTAPTLKHYLAYNNEVRRDTTSAFVPPRVLHEYDEVPFRIPLQANAATGVMPGYNLVNGRPSTVSPDLDSIRQWTDRPLFNPSDAFAPGNLTASQQYYATQAEANAAAVKAGINSFTQDGTNAAGTVDAIHAALDQGLLTAADIDDAVKQSLSLRFRLGEFDPDGGPYAAVTADAAANARLAREAAAESMVLLKNTGVLPLRAPKTVAVVGPLADTLYSDWYGGNMPYQVTPRQGIAERLGTSGTVRSSEGVDRIALRETSSGRYVTGGSGASGAMLAANGTAADATAQFDVFDWGAGVVTLRSVANGKTVGYNWSGFANDQAQPNGWFVQQQFKLETRADGATVLRYVGYESAFDWAPSYHNPYVVVQADGTLNLGAATAAEATAFTRSVVRSGVGDAVAAATGADAAVVVVGSMPFINGREDHDRTDLSLAEGQAALVRAVRQANPNTVVVVENSYPTALNWEQANVPALLWTSHAGQETGHALADVLFGDVNPSGRLTQTWYRSAADLPSITDYDIIGSDRTYQYFTGQPLYPIGYGLSYTTFHYGRLSVGRSTVSVDVTNTGARAGDEVVQLYTHQRTSRVEQPLKQLRGFQKVHLAPGQTRRVTFSVDPSDFRFWDVTRDRWVVEDATHDILVGASSSDIRARGTLRVRGETIPPRDLRSTTSAQNFDSYSGITLVDFSKAAGTSVGASAGGQWVRYADTDLRGGPASFSGRFANPGAATTVQVRLDNPRTGPVLATLTVPSTGDPYAYTTVTGALARATGRHDVYLVFGGPVRLATFALR
ncbi:glycoside hydrolase family 3 C-terminal domain-containing protein [Dactylosporangium sp. NPDC005572]|uniref:glycoside hydrolase family 3 protein n=1 Tax=Dactylosporangium sp. NPDC005572 TaxID=3156889 RepID=UPI0033A58312